MKRQRSQVNDTQRSNRTPLEPKTAKQKEYLDALRFNDQVFAIGPAGTGKTYLPTVLATKMYLLGDIQKIILSRPAVEAAEEKHGFLPGNLTQKLAPWVLPVTEIIEEIMGREAFETMLKSGDLEVAPFTYMRGRTFQNAFVILDEAQNTTPAQMEMFMTRIGEGTKVVVCGDLRQTDRGTHSGLSSAVALINRYKIPAKVIEFTSADIVRSGICKMWAEAYERGV